jgi:hypothetical protein
MGCVLSDLQSIISCVFPPKEVVEVEDREKEKEKEKREVLIGVGRGRRSEPVGVPDF